MSKKILLSLAIIGVAAAMVVGATTAYFSDTETSTGNVFAAGTIDINLTDLDNDTWTGEAVMNDMKPCYTDYVNFIIHNDDSEGANPVNVWKKLKGFDYSTGIETESECTDQGGKWDYNSEACDWDYYDDSSSDNNRLDKVVLYDLTVRVYNSDNEIWWTTIYDEEVTLRDIKGNEVSEKGFYLGMIPAGGYMEVEQSYHMKPDTGNWAQGDEMTFDIEVYAEQLKGEIVLEDKQATNEDGDYWKINHESKRKGTLTYQVRSPEFEFEFEGVAPEADQEYVLIAGPNATNPTVKLGEGSSNGSYGIAFSGSNNLNQDLSNAKVWLVPETNWNDNDNEVIWPIPWESSSDIFLWETGLIDYEDTDA